jgi:hypothetical protein
MRKNSTHLEIAGSKDYLSSRTILPTITSTMRINKPADDTTGTARDRTSVTILSCLGDLTGDSVASIRPSATKKQPSILQVNTNILTTQKVTPNLHAKAGETSQMSAT